MDFKANRKVRKKHQIWERFRESGDIIAERENRLNTSAEKGKKRVWNDICKQVKKNPKKFIELWELKD